MPSRKVISVFIICSAFVLAIVLSSNSKAVNTVSKTVGGSLSSGPKVEIAENSDWQNQVEEFGKVSAGATGSTTDTLTDDFSRTFMMNYLALKKSDSLDSSSAATLVDQSLKFITDGSAGKTYTLKDILVSSDTSVMAITKYGNSLGLAFKSNAPKGEVKNEIEILKDMLEREEDRSGEIKNITAVYTNTLSSISQITVPASMVSDHLEMLNGLNTIAVSLKDIGGVLSDPVKSLAAFQSYSTGFGDFTTAYLKIKISILKSGANYKQGDNGYFLYFGI